MESFILKQQQYVYGSFCYVSRVLITLSGSMQAQRLTSGAVGWSCTPCCAALCPLMTSTSPLCLRRSEEASSTSPSTWPALWPRCSCSCCRWTLSREPPSKTSGAHHALLGSSGPEVDDSVSSPCFTADPVTLKVSHLKCHYKTNYCVRQQPDFMQA